jgi:hypothetical protein
MPDLGAYDQPVRFDWDAAANLSREFRAVADLLDAQAGQRTSNAASARRQWDGVYGQQFDGRLRVCTSDAGRLATAMRSAAHAIDTLAEWARDEQDRRNRARAWVEAQRNESFLKSGWDSLTGGDQPPSEPSSPPPFPVLDVAPADRGPAVPAGVL